MFLLTIGIAILLPLIGFFLSDAPALWPFSVFLYSTGLVLVLGSYSKRKSATVALGIIFLPLLILETSYFISQYLQGAAFNKAFWYHFRPDVIYAGIGEFLWLAVFVLCIFSSLLFSFYRFSTRFNYAGKKVVIGGIGLFFLGLVMSPSATSFSVALLSAPQSSHDDLYAEFPELENNSVSAKFTGEERKNVVFIYLESIEQRYFDESVFPDLLPEMKALKDQSLVFTDVAQGIGAEYTMGGIVASECGYPLATQHNITSGSFGMYDDFLPLATCLGDILNNDGYFESFMGGADARFAGKQKFLNAHGFSEVIDKTAILDQSEAAVPVNSWGVYDDTLFKHAFTKYLSLNSQPNPFLLTLLTLDTHHPSGHTSPSCGIYGAGDNSILNAAHCTDSLVGLFIQKIRSSAYSDQTIIVVFSDHLAQRNTSSSLLRTSTILPNLTFFVNFPNGQSGVNTNPGTHYDVAPTILDLMGYDLKGQMGFGTSLIKGPGYLIEKFGKDGWQDKNIILMKYHLPSGRMMFR